MASLLEKYFKKGIFIRPPLMVILYVADFSEIVYLCLKSNVFIFFGAYLINIAPFTQAIARFFNHKVSLSFILSSKT